MTSKKKLNLVLTLGHMAQTPFFHVVMVSLETTGCYSTLKNSVVAVAFVLAAEIYIHVYLRIINHS